MDSFFASVEQQANPKLAGKPVGVIKGPGRTCIIAASREAKKLGIKTGTTTYEARAIYPKIILVPADFDKYFAVTQKFIEICSRFSPDLEVFSIDELFLDISQTKGLFGGTWEICRKIKEALRREMGRQITCSIGISYNRLLAKLASGVKKPDGIFEITSENKDEVLFSRRLTEVCGLGKGLEKRLFNLGITDFKNLRTIPTEYLEAGLGPFWPKELKRLSYGEDDSLLTRIGDSPAGGSKMKSVSRTFTLYESTTDLDQIRGTLRNLCEEATFKAREMGMRGRVVGLAVRGNGQSDYRQKTLKYFADDGREIFLILWRLFEEMGWSASWRIRFLGVWLGDLRPKSEQMASLFPEEKRKENLVAAMDKVNNRFGELTIYPAILLRGDLIKSEVNGFLGDKSFRFQGFGD
jgi:DNA polymerase-4